MNRTASALRQALQDNMNEPEGPARNAVAERLVDEAGQAGDTGLLLDTLFNVLSAYNFSSESEKMFVPFARVLRMWDERPEDFDRYAEHRLHWMFKWVASGMLDQPDIPLASVEKWHAEMEHRYRVAGHSERAVRQSEFRIARDTGDTARAERAFAAWLAADRDPMSDCHACELHTQGDWLNRLGRPEEALETWRPVLAGEHTCAHEPHVVLAASLLPLVRLGRVDEARAHHLRGYRMIRDMESMRATVGDHIEFCALTGNEARALEILAEHTGHFAPSGDPLSLLDFLAPVALLARRLTDLGLGERRVPGPAGREWTAAELHTHARAEALELAGRFDRRNGSTVVGDRVRARTDAAPLAERLPLGVRAERLTVPRPAPAAPPAPASPDDVRELLATARRLTEDPAPGVRAAWEAFARAAHGREDELDPLGRAELADHEAMERVAEPEKCVEGFRSAALLYEDAGHPAQAALARARAALALSFAGRAAEAVAAVEAECALLRGLHAEGRAEPRSVATALLYRCRVLRNGSDDGPGNAGDALSALEAALDEAAAFGEEHRAAGRMMSGRLADILRLRGELALEAGDPARAAEWFGRAVELTDEADLAWYAPEARVGLARAAMACGDPETAVGAARSALEHGAGSMEAGSMQEVHAAQVHILLSEALTATGRHEPAVEHALEAAHRADQAGESATLGAWARLTLGGALHRLGRADEAASVLETALPDLEEGHGEGQVVQARWWLGECLAALGDHREAAGQFLRAASVAQHWEDQRDHAVLAHMAADCLGRAGRDDEAERAYRRAEALWRDLDRPEAYVRVLRARAWLAARGEDDGPARARELMAEAERACAAALAAAGDDEARELLRGELAGTHRQTGELIVRCCEGVPGDDEEDAAREAYEEGLAHLGRAVAVFTEAGPALRDQRTSAELAAAWLEIDLGRNAAAADRARAVLAEYGDASEGVAETRRAEAESILMYATRESPSGD
ncbi:MULTISPECIES: tetratricopeptide repeat protein [Streptomyces]|uniref:tetratricopeptide repeat protein n=1 Tax=Streptomyces TaxID=1883 RepID=UPI00163C44BE|nr:MULTISPECIES: tetratricopeptide repeat protein [Streptomyces]MBC2878579.1 tetratricopeptide repeat protein [Streptomyces sp. TYQ1024]UBI35237.1 tetratricopeptide repeat protein [Streptomyces mobaraensis]UKW27828.1 tetratricopeptide repeat protein [Streptomyces sp. TYQ1024]